MYRKKRILSTALFTSMVSLMVCGVCNAASDTMADRMAELAALQAENSSFNFNRDANTVAFPGTFQDLSRQERIDIYTQSYKPFFNRDTYRPLNVIDDTADRKARDCNKVYACVEQYGKAEKEAEDAFFKTYIDYKNAFYFESDAKWDALASKWLKVVEVLAENWKMAELSPCFCVKDLDFAEYILQDLNMSCDEEGINQSKENVNAYYDKLMEELKAVDEEWIEINKDKTYNNHVVVTTAAVKNEGGIPIKKLSIDTTGGGYHRATTNSDGDTDCHLFDPLKDTSDEENLFLGACNSGSQGYWADYSGGCDRQTVCILGKSCNNDDKAVRDDFCYWADTGPMFHGDVWTSNYSLSKCTGGKWQQATGNDKVKVFVNSNGEVLATTNGWLLKSIINPGNYDVKCVANICSNYTYGCADGTCPAAGADCVPEKHAPKAEPWTANVKYRNTVKPYLDVLSKCKSSSSKTGTK